MSRNQEPKIKMDPSVRWDEEQKAVTRLPAPVSYACSIVQSNGCWLIRAYSLTWETLDSATSRV